MDVRIPSFNSLLEEIKVEQRMDVYQDMLHQSWDSGVVMDSNTVLQMAEFQEVVDNLQKGLPPPPPYHFHVPPSFKVSPAVSSDDPELDHLINSAPVLFRTGALSYQEGGRPQSSSLGKEPLRVPCRSLPLLTETNITIVDKVEQKYTNIPIRFILTLI